MGFGGEWYHLVPLFSVFCGATSRSRYHSLENQGANLRGLGQSPSSYFLLFAVVFIRLVQTMAFAHGDTATNGNGVGIMDNPVHDGVGNRAVLVGISVNAFIPAIPGGYLEEQIW